MTDTIEQIIRRIVREELSDLVESVRAAVVAITPSAPEAVPYVLTVGQAADRSQRHKVTVGRALEADELHGSQSMKGGRLLVKTECLDAWSVHELCPHR